MKKRRERRLWAETTEREVVKSADVGIDGKKLYVILGRNESGRLIKVEAVVGQTGQTVAGLVECIGRLITLCLKNRERQGEIIEAMLDIPGRGLREGGPQYVEGKLVRSFPQAIGMAMGGELKGKKGEAKGEMRDEK